ncbi:MAG TPA: uracil-DNA glycosylase [Candidatus Saccharimonadales bacterium]|nr:uracil-DNA glycosylase [Candidatus Saccharimonadales bacterium]
MPSKLELLAKVRADVLTNDVCPDLAAMAKNLVMGDGAPDADIVFIGEAPGKNEDEQGLPFVGAAGKFLNEMLMSVGLERKDVFITNIVKYRPPNNRDPLPEEKQAFWPYLARQLEIIEPKVIVTLGRHSMEFFLPDRKISQIHGQPKKLPVKLHDGRESSWIILPLYHPAAALYNGGMRQTLIDDFQAVKQLL